MILRDILPGMASVATGTRETILERSVQLATAEGLEGVSIGRLASDLGLSKSGLFRHFGSKEELQLATVRAASAIFEEEVLEPTADEESGFQRLSALCRLYLEYLEREAMPGGGFWSAASAEFDGRPGPVRDAVRAMLRSWMGLLEREARVAGSEDPRQLAFELHALTQEANWAFQLFEDATAFGRARKGIERLLDEL